MPASAKVPAPRTAQPAGDIALALAPIQLLAANPPHFFQHIGLYAYRREFLLQLSRIPQSGMEKLEKLEQLRVLDAGYSIFVGVVDEPPSGIETAEDYRRFVERCRCA